jgi:hypothetical protein
MKTNFLKITGLVLILLAIPGLVLLVQNPSKSQFGIKAGRIQEALLFFIPSELRVSRGDVFEISMKIDTGNETAGGVKAVVNFDPQLFELQNIVKSNSAFAELTTERTVNQVIIEGEGSLIGRGTIADLTFEAINYGEREIEVGANSVVWDKNKKTNIIDSTSGVIVTIE